MHTIHLQTIQYGTKRDGRIDYVQGANIAGFSKVANAMLSYGVVLWSCLINLEN